jgi:hypothetical protein
VVAILLSLSSGAVPRGTQSDSASIPGTSVPGFLISSLRD